MPIVIYGTKLYWYPKPCAYIYILNSILYIYAQGFGYRLQLRNLIDRSSWYQVGTRNPAHIQGVPEYCFHLCFSTFHFLYWKIRIKVRTFLISRAQAEFKTVITLYFFCGSHQVIKVWSFRNQFKNKH